MCPLVPVMTTLPRAWRDNHFGNATPSAITKGYLRYFEPDVYVETKEGQLSKAGIDRDGLRLEHKRCRSFSELFYAEPGSEPSLSVGIGMDTVYEHLYRKQFQFKFRHDRRVLEFFGGDLIGKAFFEAAYGMFPEAKNLNYMSEFYRGALAAERAEANVGTWARIEKGEAMYPLFFTTHDIEKRFDSLHGPAFFVFDPLSPEDTIDFWNFRLFTRDVVPVNVHWLAQSRDLMLEMVRLNHRPLPRNPNGVMISTTIHIARSVNKEAVVTIMDVGSAGLPQGSIALQDWYERIWMQWENDRIHHPAAVTLSAKRRESQVVLSDGESSTIRVPSISPEFPFRHSGYGPRWVNVVKTHFYGQNTKFAEAMPSAAVDSRSGYPTRGAFDQYPSREGYVAFHDFAHDGAYLSLPTMKQAISSWLAADYFEVSTSDSGRVTEQVIASVGGLGGMGLLGDPETLILFNNMARSRHIREGGDSEEFQGRTATIGQLDKLMNKLKEKRSFRHFNTKERFVEAGILRLGIAVKCSHCTKENWYSLDDIGSTIRCERCLKDFSFPEGATPPRNTWKYRVVGPFATPHFAQGAYSVALALRFLKTRIGSSMDEFTFAAGLELKRKNQSFEADFFAWHNDRDFGRSARDPAALIGECKSLGTEAFKKEDFARLRTLGELIPGSFLVAATLKDSLSMKEVAGLRGLAKWGWKHDKNHKIRARVIVLTGTELFGNGPLYNVWHDSGGHLAEVASRYQHIYEFDDLAQATQQAYLGFTQDEITSMKYRIPARRG